MAVRVRIANTLFFSLSLILFLYVCGIGLKNVFRYNTFKIEYKTLLEDVKTEQDKQAFFTSQLARIDSPSFWEEQAKTRLGLIKQGEVVYQFVEAK